MKQTGSGFTLIELMLAMILFATVSAGVTAFAAYYFNNYSFSFEENQSVGLAQSALTRMIRDIREARVSEAGSWPIVAANDDSFTFYSDVDNDNLSDQVRYFMNGSNLHKGVIKPTLSPISYPAANEAISIIATNIDTGGGPIFRYYNGNWPADQINNPLSQSSRQYGTRYVLVYFKINIDPARGSLPFELTTGVTLRNIKDNL
jgi:prepilin-type N-terminal cleavage/methylation domain-containing protein